MGGLAVLRGDECLARGVHLVKPHARSGQFAQGIGVETQRVTPVDHTFEVGPAGLQRGGIRAERRAREGRYSTGKARDQREVGALPAGEGGGLSLIGVGEGGGGESGLMEVFFGPRRQAKRGDAAHVPGRSTVGPGSVDWLDRRGATQQQVTAAKNPRVPRRDRMVQHGAQARPLEVRQQFLGHGHQPAGALGDTGRAGEQPAGSWPQHAGLPGDHPGDRGGD